MSYSIKRNKNKFLIILILLNLFFINQIHFISSIKDYIYKNKLSAGVKMIYEKYYKVNINEIERKIIKKKEPFRYIKSIVNIGFTLDKKYVLETMITITSIMATQKKTTKIRFHFGVTNNFTAEKMLKIYELRNRINNLTEFNFYYLKESVIKMKNFHYKGEACPGKFELPSLLPDDIERLIIFDAGDLLVLRDLTNLYNYNMSDYWALGTVEPTIIDSFMKTRYNMSKYLNIGSILLNVKKLKQYNFWAKYCKKRYIPLMGAPDQTLFNIIIPDEKKNYLPFKFGGYTLFTNDQNYDNLSYIDYKFKAWFNSSLSSSLPDNPKSEEGILLNLYNPVFIHQFWGKWKIGDGLSIYRHLTKYFIKLTGISDEICKVKKGYCK